jgi:transposase
MIDQDKRKAIWCLHNEGMGLREISRRLGVCRNTVSAIVSQKGGMPDGERKDKTELDAELLRRLYGECEGRVQRIFEKLSEEEKVRVGYSTLTRLLRELDLGQSRKSRCDRVPDEPGAEMQHDTSPYRVTIGATLACVVGSLLYLRYSKMRYVRFYRAFNRFRMKCFFHEALSFLGYSAGTCIIDNTNLARLRGSGKNAVMVPEMERFAEEYGFQFVCHEIGHADRKAGNERSFYTVETNFFPGRTFESLEDMNRQAFEWATVRLANRAVGKTRLIPLKAFEHEQQYLRKVPAYLPPPYLLHQRSTDQYGYAAVNGNFYWVPGTSRIDVRVLEYSSCLKIFHNRKLLVEYALPPDGVRNKILSPPGQPQSHYRPTHRMKPTDEEQKKLKAVSEDVAAYLNFVLEQKGIQKHRFIRGMHSLYQKVALPVFVKAIQRARKYRITDLQTLERIALLQMQEGEYALPLVDLPGELQNRESYREGCYTDDGDLSAYDRQSEDEDG